MRTVCFCTLAIHAAYRKRAGLLWEGIAPLCGTASILDEAHWTYENCFAVTRDQRAPRFFAAWNGGAEFMQGRRLYSGEGGVIGLAAAFARWPVDFAGLEDVARAVRHEAVQGARTP